MKKIIIALLALSFAFIGAISCNKDSLSSEEKMLVGTWKKWDNYSAAYGNGWTDKLVLNSDHSCEFDIWWVGDGSSIEHTVGTWSYDKYTRVLTYNTISEVDQRPWNESKFVLSLSDKNMTLMDMGDGGSCDWAKQ